MTVRLPASLLALFADAPDAPVELAALCIAADLDPSLDARAVVNQLDEYSQALPRGGAHDGSPEALAALVGTHLYDGLGFAGDEATYYHPDNSLLHRVLARRRGIPIALAVVMMALCRRVGIDAEGIGFPGHFLVRIGGVRGVYVDPFFHGRVLQPADLEALSRQVTGDAGRLRPEHLAPVGSRAMAVRMLFNLKGAYERAGDASQALLVCDRLVELTGHVEFVRARGLHALALGAHAAAADDLARYLAHPDARRPDPDALAGLQRARAGAANHRPS